MIRETTSYPQGCNQSSRDETAFNLRFKEFKEVPKRLESVSQGLSKRGGQFVRRERNSRIATGKLQETPGMTATRRREYCCFNFNIFFQVNNPRIALCIQPEYFSRDNRASLSTEKLARKSIEPEPNFASLLKQYLTLLVFRLRYKGNLRICVKNKIKK